MTVASVKPTKKLTLHERFSVTRQNAGNPHAITLAVAYTPSGLPTQEAVANRVDHLQTLFPLLWVDIRGVRTTAPYYESRDAPWPASDIINERKFIPVSDAKDDMARVLRDELTRFEAIDFESRPLWSVSLLHPEPGAGVRAFFVLSANHSIIDGRGAQRLLLALLGEGLDNVTAEDITVVKSFDDTIPHKPTLPFLAPVIFHELLVPQMPAFIQPYFRRNIVWPGADVSGSPLDCDWGISLVTVPAPVVAKLKIASKSHGVATLHPILKMAYMAAVWRVFGSTKPYLHLEASTARDERQADLGHAHCTANYVSSFEYTKTLLATDQFWVLARSLADDLKSPKGIRDGRMSMGLLGLIPDSPVDENNAMYDPSLPTGWERHFVQRARSPAPFRGSIALSNLGFTALPEGAVDLAWAQSASPFAPVFNVGLIGHSNGIQLSAVWREGAAVTKEQTEAVHETFAKLLEKAAAGIEGTIATMTE